MLVFGKVVGDLPVFPYDRSMGNGAPGPGDSVPGLQGAAAKESKPLGFYIKSRSWALDVARESQGHGWLLLCREIVRFLLQRRSKQSFLVM